MTEQKVSTVKIKEMVTKAPQEIKPGMSLKSLLATDTIRRRFEELLGKKSAGFISSIISATQVNPHLQTSDPMSVISASVIAASLDLPINSSLGFAHIVPYSGKAQFQMGWRGFVQLAQRSGQLLTINVTEVYDGELKEYDRFTGIMHFDETGKKSDKIIGYVAYLKLLNGFEKWVYMTTEQAATHGRRFSKTFQNGPWKTDFDSMAKKTVIKALLSKWGILSIEMQKAIDFDQAAVKEDLTPEYIDVPSEGEVTKEKEPQGLSVEKVSEIMKESSGNK